MLARALPENDRAYKERSWFGPTKNMLKCLSVLYDS